MLYDILKAEKDKVLVYVDMDGVLTDYGTINIDVAKIQEEGFFTNKRPVRTIIKELEKASTLPNVEIEILSITRTEAQIKEKLDWLDKYVPFVKNRNIFSRLRFNLDASHVIKEEYIESEAPKNKKIYLIDDDHQVLRHVKYKLGDKINVLHISSIIE